MRAFLKPILIAGVAIIIVVLVSWFAFPAWRTQPGGAVTLIGAAIVGVLAVAKEVISIAKDWRELTKPPAKKAVSASRPRRPAQTQLAVNSEGSDQYMKRSGGNQKQTVQDSPNSRQRME